MAGFKSFEDLQCWKEARKLRIFVSEQIITRFPESEKYSLTSQIRSSSRSVGNNIAEGFGRFNYQENIQFCRIGRGSLFETLDHGITAFDERYISDEILNELRIHHNKTLVVLNGILNI